MNSTNFRTMCVINPVAGNKRAGQRWSVINEVLQKAGFEYDVTFTNHALHAVQITREALQHGYDRIVAVGGDGTLNEVVNGFFSVDGQGINPKAVLLLIPVGTGSDFSRMFEVDSSIECVLRLMSLNEQRNCDVVRTSFFDYNGQKTVRHYINIGDVGIGSETCARVNRNSKVLGGFWSFLLAALYTIITYRNRRLKVLVDNKEVYNGPCGLVAVANGRFFGGGVKIAPEALVDDGLLDVVMVKNFGKPELLANIAKAYRGAHLNHPKVELCRGRRVNIITEQKEYLELDGEPVVSEDIEFEVIPAGIKIMV